MNTANNPETNTHNHAGNGGRRHRWLMIACCIPMVLIAIALVAAGVVSASFLFFVIACTAMMALMMGNMGHGGSK